MLFHNLNFLGIHTKTGTMDLLEGSLSPNAFCMLHSSAVKQQAATFPYLFVVKGDLSI